MIQLSDIDEDILDELEEIGTEELGFSGDSNAVIIQFVGEEDVADIIKNVEPVIKSILDYNNIHHRDDGLGINTAPTSNTSTTSIEKIKLGKGIEQFFH